MKKNYRQVFLAIIGMILLGAVNLYAGEFSDFSNDELIQKRSEMQGMKEENRENFREEIQKRMREMNKEERNKFLKDMGADVSQSDKVNGRGSAESTKLEEKNGKHEEKQKKTMKRAEGSKSGDHSGSGRRGGGMGGRKGGMGR